jgi:hypothetical protein
MASKNYFDNYAYHQNLVYSAEVSNLIKEIRQQEAEHGGRNNISAFVDRGEWSILIDRKN